MSRITILSFSFLIAAAGVRAAEPGGEAAPCAETDFDCIQGRETEKFDAAIERQKQVWLDQWTDAKKRGETMMKEHKLSCGELSGMERMKCRVQAAKKLKEWKDGHQAKKDEYLERISKLKTDFKQKQKEENSMWSALEGDFTKKARGLKDQLLGGDTVESFLGPSQSGESLESRVNAAVERGAAGAAGAAASAGQWAQERTARFEQLKQERAACRSAAQVSSCLEQAGADHDRWKREFETRKRQAEEAARGLNLPTTP